jgi:hypothetical protein
VTDNTLITQPRQTVRVKELQRASRRLGVFPIDAARGLYAVESATRPGEVYEVALEPQALTGRCTCPWAEHGGTNCKHIMAALRAHYGSQAHLSFWRTREDARRQHRRVVAGQGVYATLRPRRLKGR